MKIEWLVADVTPAGSPDRVECDILGVILDNVLTDSGLIYLWSGSHFVMHESPLRPQYLYLRSFGMTLDVFWPIQAGAVVGGPLCDAGMPS